MSMFFQLLFLSLLQGKKKPKYAPYHYKKNDVSIWSEEMRKKSLRLGKGIFQRSQNAIEKPEHGPYSGPAPAVFCSF